MTELLIGCGSSRKKKIEVGGRAEWSALTTLDMTDHCKPDVIHDLDVLPYPFEADSFDEIHAYDVLEHQGRQGDWKFFFAQWSEFWRILKHGGLFCGICPKSSGPWTWGDPGHTRVISPESLVFLSQKTYKTQVGTTPMTDYRFCYSADFQMVWMDDKSQPDTWHFVLQAIKTKDIA